MFRRSGNDIIGGTSSYDVFLFLDPGYLKKAVPSLFCIAGVEAEMIDSVV